MVIYGILINMYADTPFVDSPWLASPTQILTTQKHISIGRYLIIIITVYQTHHQNEHIIANF